jgi:membrane-associated protein
MEATEKAIQLWMQEWGYHAVVPSLLVDPAGVPWAWIFLMLLAEQARMNIALVLLYGFFVLMLSDHVLYWIGSLGSHKLLPRFYTRWPGLEEKVEHACHEVTKRGAFAIVFGRYIPFVGRWTGLGAGLAGVPYAKFALLDAIGAGISVFGFGILAHVVGRETMNHPLFHEVLLGLVVAASLATGIGFILARYIRRPAPMA